MSDYQSEFLQLALRKGVLKFGEFELKSGRISPYFFNAGLFDDGEALTQLGRYYAQTIVDSGIQFDVLFGPAYKGIPLAAATAVALSSEHGINTPFAFNRKEKKDHGEGGTIVGAALTGRVLVIDDVMTAGKAVRESVEIIHGEGAALAGVVISLDRKERGQGAQSAVQEVAEAYGVPVTSIATMDDLIRLLERSGDNAAALSKMQAYRDEYGV